jgi:hypothetical protein
MKRFKHVFLAAGYREISEDAWAKPVGYGIFTIKDFIISYRFRSFDRSQVLLWKSENLIVDPQRNVDDEEVINSIMSFENYEFHMMTFMDQGFHFLTKDQQVQLCCGL